MQLGVHIQVQQLRAKRADSATEEDATTLAWYYDTTGTKLMQRLIPGLVRSLTNDAIPIQRRCVPPHHSIASSALRAMVR